MKATSEPTNMPERAPTLGDKALAHLVQNLRARNAEFEDRVALLTATAEELGQRVHERDAIIAAVRAALDGGDDKLRAAIVAALPPLPAAKKVPA